MFRNIIEKGYNLHIFPQGTLQIKHMLRQILEKISTFFCEIRSVKLLYKKKENYFLDSSIIIVWCLSTSRYFSFIVTVGYSQPMQCSYVCLVET